MYLTKVAPLARIPRPSAQFLSYFTTHKLERGALILIPLRKKKVKAIVFSQTKVLSRKMEIKKANFELKPISKILEKNPVINENQIKLAKWLSDYYWAPFGKVLSSFLRNSKKLEIKSSPMPTTSSQKEKFKFASFDYSPQKEIENCFKEKKEVLFLVPEKTKEKFWKDRLKNFTSPNLIIGTRANIFRPFKSLGLIVLTEEGNQNYKSQMEPKYNTKMAAEKLADIWQAKLIVVSSFPSVETYFKTTSNQNIIRKPPIENQIVDMRKIKPWTPLSEELINETKKTINKNGKVLLFINRRGTATTLLCQDCGWIQKCENCNVPLTYYLRKTADKIVPELVCHYCGKSYKAPRLCKKCKSWNLKTLGVGTEKIEEELVKSFEKEKVLRLDGEASETEKEQKAILQAFLENKASILLTTSIIFKYFPIEKIPLVGIISLDALLSQPDFKLEEECARITERLLSASNKKLILQTFFPDSKAISWIKKDKEIFYKETLKERKVFHYPPFYSLIKLSTSNNNQTLARNEAFALKKKIEERAKSYNDLNLEIIGPAPAFIEKLRGKYQWKLILKLNAKESRTRNNLLSVIPLNWQIDIDPERII